MIKKEIVKIGFDLDGVIIGKPPFIPKSLLEWLVRSHKTSSLAYRYPTSRFERWIRWLSHHPKLRPPIEKNAKTIKILGNKKECKLYAVSSRYAFLKGRTQQWFKNYDLDNFFEEIHINLENEQPHKFKEKMIKKLNLDIFIDDDLPLIEYISNRVNSAKIVSVAKHKDHLKKMFK